MTLLHRKFHLVSGRKYSDSYWITNRILIKSIDDTYRISETIQSPNTDTNGYFRKGIHPYSPLGYGLCACENVWNYGWLGIKVLHSRWSTSTVIFRIVHLQRITSNHPNLHKLQCLVIIQNDGVMLAPLSHILNMYNTFTIRHKYLYYSDKK